jgi:Flp pilus assembly protein TadG
MWKVLARARESFVSNEKGNVAILFAFSAIPLIGLMGGAVDVTRHQRYKTEIANALDAATLALVKRGAKDDADADNFVNGYVATMMTEYRADKMLHLAKFDAAKVDGGYRVSSSGYMDTAFLPVVGIRQMPLDLSAEVLQSSQKYEVALALDNTGSMDSYGRIEALRDAAGDLVDDLYAEPGTEDRVKMALVPFVTTVNIKTPGVYDEAKWIEPTGDPKVFGFDFATPTDRLDLFKKMHVSFGGCVEARQAPYDEDDTAPTSAATRFVPYLWPDEPDSRGYNNSYLKDASASGSDLSLLRDVAKYSVGSGTTVSNTASKGPNAACPRPIVELTNDKDRLHTEIEAMKPYNPGSLPNNSGTNVAQGLSWGWRVLSPGEPYTQGAPYSDKGTTKVLVLLSDGRNQIVPNGDDTRSDYTGYGYLAAGRMNSTTDFRTAEKFVDSKVSDICEKVKGTGIRVYTILFQVDFASTQDLFRDCASKDEEGKPLYYYVPDADALARAFDAIGEDLTTLHVAS